MRIQLLKPHTHAGQQRAAGARLELDDELARWLIDLRVARAVSAAPKPQTETHKQESNE